MPCALTEARLRCNKGVYARARVRRCREPLGHRYAVRADTASEAGDLAIGDVILPATRIYGEHDMNRLSKTTVAIGLTIASCAAIAEGGMGAPPTVVLKSTVAGMPTSAGQEIRVLTALLDPGQHSVFHTHRFPVTTYVLEGELTLDMKGAAPVVIKAGEAFVEPTDTPVTARNASTTDTMRVAIFYVSDGDAPFLDPISQ